MGLGKGAMEVGAGVAKGGGDVIQHTQQSAGFLEVKAANAGVEHGANTALQAAQKAPDIAVKIATSGINWAVEAGKLALTATGVGAAVTAAIEAVQTVVNKGLEKIQEGAKEGASVTQKSASSMQWVTDPTSAGPMKDGVEDLQKSAGEVTNTIQSVGKTAGGMGGPSEGAGGPEGLGADLGALEDPGLATGEVSITEGTPSSEMGQGGTESFGAAVNIMAPGASMEAAGGGMVHVQEVVQDQDGSQIMISKDLSQSEFEDAFQRQADHHVEIEPMGNSSRDLDGSATPIPNLQGKVEQNDQPAGADEVR